MRTISFYYFVASRLIRGTKNGRSTTSLLRLTTIGVALSVAVLLISVSIILGFKENVSQYAYGQTGHLSLYAYGNSWDNVTTPIELSPRILQFIRQQDEVHQATPIIQQVGLLKTENNFAGVSVYGVDSSFPLESYIPRLREGHLPNLLLSDTQYELLLPSSLADRMNYKIGDRIHIYYLENKVRVRAYKLVGIYQASIESMPAICGVDALRSLNHWSEDEYSRLLIKFCNPNWSEIEVEQLTQALSSKSDWVGHTNYALNSAKELSPMLFSWLELLDANVYFLLVLMLAVGGFTMITGVIIVVLDKARQIGIIKALGATESQIRHIFLTLSAQLILRGLLWGNIIAGLFCFLQSEFRLIKLNPESYFMDAVPINLDYLSWLGINVGALLLILLMTIAPTKIISKIKPSESMRID